MTSYRIIFTGRNSELSPTVCQDVLGPAWSMVLPRRSAVFYSGKGNGALPLPYVARGMEDRATDGGKNEQHLNQPHMLTIEDARAVPQTPPGVAWGEIAVLAGIGAFMLGFFIPWTLP